MENRLAQFERVTEYYYKRNNAENTHDFVKIIRMHHHVFIMYVAGAVAKDKLGTLNVVEPSPGPHVVPILANKAA